MKKIIFGLAALIAFGFTSCASDDDNGTTTTGVTAPATYEFTRNGVSSVSFTGQTARVAMAGELANALKDNTKTLVDLNEMFADGTGFTDASLNTSGKKLRNKCAASKDFFSTNTTDATAIKNQFDTWISSQTTDVFPNWAATATAGNAGQLQESGGGSTRYVNAKGLELNQAVAKSMIGALMLDQILNNYLSPAKLEGGTNLADNNNGVLETGKNFTTMEHNWDEAYGYLYGAEANPAVPVLGADSFLNKYLGKVDGDSDFAGIADAIYNAFKLGRAAIVAKNYTVRNEQAAIIRENLSKVIAVRAVHYLQAGKGLIGAGNDAKKFHELSEGFGFVYALQFTREPGTANPYFTKSEIDAYISTLMTGNGFWDVTPATLDSISDEISAEFGFTTNQA